MQLVVQFEKAFHRQLFIMIKEISSSRRENIISVNRIQQLYSRFQIPVIRTP